MNNTINNSPVNFQAKMYLVDDLSKNARLKKIIKEFEEKTANRYPNYEVFFGRPEDLSKDKLSIAINRGIEDVLSTREHVLSKDATEKFMQLSDNKIIEKLTKLLGIVKKRDKFWDNFSNDVAKVEKKYGIEFDENTYDKMMDDAIDQISSKNKEKILKDDILSDFVESHHIYYV